MSKVVLYMAISADGFIAGPDDDTEWVGDDSWQSYLKFVGSCDALLVGYNTFQLMEPDEFVAGPQYFIATRDSQAETGKHQKIAISSAEDLPKVEKLGVIGGAELNGSLAQLQVIDEIILDIEPVMLGEGIRLFGEHKVNLNLELLSSKLLGTQTVQNHYKVIR